MRKPLLASLLAVAFAASANAATLSVTADQVNYAPGDTVTLTVVAGDSGEARALFVYGRLLFDNPSVANFASGAPNQTTLLAFGSLPWSSFYPLICTSSSCEMFNQISSVAATELGSTIPLVSTVSFVATAVGISNVAWDTSFGFGLDFFGLTNAPGTTINVVPEPTTAALLGLGLCALAIRRRREV